VTTTEQRIFSEKAIAANSLPVSSREELVEETVRIFINLMSVVENLETIAENIADTGFSPPLQNRIQTYCQDALEHRGVIPTRGSGHKIRSLSLSWLNSLDNLHQNQTNQIVQSSLRQWDREVEDVRRLSRDLVNRIFYRNKQKSRELVEATAMEHPLVKSWEGLSKKDAVERISKSRMVKFLNKQANFLEILLQRTHMQTLPSRITLEPTSACNYRCTMCSQGHYTERPSYFEIDDDTVERALPVLEFIENLATQVTGEPTLSLQLGKIANYASSHGVNIDMITNGSLLHKTNADLSKFSTICISFDGSTKEVFEAQRVGSSFENVLKNIRLTREQNPLVQFDFNVCVTRLNINQLPDIVRLAADLGVDRVTFNPINTQDYPISCDLPHLGSLAIGSNNLDELNTAVNAAQEAAIGTNVRVVNHLTDGTFIPELVDKPKPIADILSQLAKLETRHSNITPEDTAETLLEKPFPFLADCFGPISHAEFIKDLPSDFDNPPAIVNCETVNEKYEELFEIADSDLGDTLQLPYCTAPYTGGIIYANGDYIPCCYVSREASFGSIAHTSFDKIWNNAGLQELRESMYAEKLLMPTCTSCNAKQRYTFITELLRTAHRLGYKWDDIKFPTNFNPPTVVKAQIEALRDELFTPGTTYRFGTPIKFGTEGNAKPFMSSGFSVPGPNGVWNDGFESILTFHLSNPTKEELLFEVSLLPFLHADLLLQQRIEVYINGNFVDSWCINRPALTQCSVSLAAALIGTDGNVQLSFRFPDATSWFHLGINKNKGTRSVMFVEATLEEVTPHK
jgi:radical SAM protein with 4Fe4S-binding SPASM domain